MRLAGNGNRRWVAKWLLLFLVVRCVAAEEGWLELEVTNVEREPLPHLRIGVEGAGQDFTEQSGRARLKLPANTGPGDDVELVLIHVTEQDKDLTFISPWDGKITIRKSNNVTDIRIGKKGQRRMLEDGAVVLAAHNVANQAASAPAPVKKPDPGAQYRPLYGEPRFLTVGMRLGREDNTGTAAKQELQQAGLLAAAQRFGFSVEEIKAAFANWGGSPLVWKTIEMTSSVEAGGTDPFPFVEASSSDIIFGTGSWSLRGCSLQPLLLKFEEKDRKRFVEIVGKDDSEWLNKTMKSSCEASSSAVLERMEEGPGTLRREWREKFSKLGYESAFQHVQVEEMTRSLEQSQAPALGMTSDQAVAFCSYIAIMAGAGMISSQQQGFNQDVGAFKRQFGREADEQERLLILADRVASSLRAAVPPFTPEFIAKAALLASGEGTVYGHQYNLADFGIGLTDSDKGTEIAAHGNKEILRTLATGWIPGQPDSSHKSTEASLVFGQPDLRQFGNSACPAGPQSDAPGEQQLVALINHERTQRGLLPLQVDARLTETARQHTAQMTQHQLVLHQVGDEAPQARRYTDIGLRTSFEGENIAMGDSVSSIHRKLMDHPEHREITLDVDFNSIGVGVLHCGSALYVTEDFAGVQQNYSNDDAASAVEEALATEAKQHGLPTPSRKPEPHLEQVACDMAKTRSLDAQVLQSLPGVRNAVAWFTTIPKDLPTGPREAVSNPLPSGYSLGICFDAKARGYWVVMVSY